MKKLLIVGGLLFFIIIAIDNYVYGASTYLSISDSSVEVGDEFSVSINVSNMNVATLTARVIADMSKVEFVSGPDNSNFYNGRAIYTWTDSTGGENTIDSGTLATFTFRAISDGTANFGISGEFYDADEEEIDTSYSGTSISINSVSEEISNEDNSENNDDNQEIFENEQIVEDEQIDQDQAGELTQDNTVENLPDLLGDFEHNTNTEKEENSNNASQNDITNEVETNNTQYVLNSQNNVTNTSNNNALKNIVNENLINQTDNADNVEVIGTILIIAVIIAIGVLTIYKTILKKKNDIY